MANIRLSIMTIVFSCFFLIFSLALPPSRTTEGIGPGGWPTTILVLMLILGILLLIKGIRERNQSTAQEKKDSAPEVHPFRHWVITGITALFILCIPIFGFVITLPLFLVTVALILGMKRKVSAISFSLISSALFIYLFTHVFQVPLPRGTGIFRSFSLLFY